MQQIIPISHYLTQDTDYRSNTFLSPHFESLHSYHERFQLCDSKNMVQTLTFQGLVET